MGLCEWCGKWVVVFGGVAMVYASGVLVEHRHEHVDPPAYSISIGVVGSGMVTTSSGTIAFTSGSG